MPSPNLSLPHDGWLDRPRCANDPNLDPEAREHQNGQYAPLRRGTRGAQVPANVRGPLDQQPGEPGWWLASDGKWYPPESAAGYEAQPTPPSGAPTPPASGNGLAVAALVLGIIGLLFGFIPLTFFMAALLGVLALLFGLIGGSRAKKRGMKTGMATAGTVLGILSIIMSIVGLVILVAVVNDTSNKLGETANSPTTTKAEGETKEATTTTAAKAKAKPVAVSGFTKYDALRETWVSVGIVLTGLSGGSQELTISLLDAAGTPIATNTEYVGSDRDGAQVLVSSSFTDNTPTAASVRVDITDASSLTDATPFPVTVASQGFDGNFWTVKGTARNDTSKNITLGKVTCVAFKAGKPVAGEATFTDTIVPGAQIAFEVTGTFDPHADAAQCQGEAS